MKLHGISEEQRLASALGWFSVGLGLTQMIAPRAVANLVGVEDRKGLMRWFGAREFAVGVGLLTQRQAKGWLWARVAGDALDLAALASAFPSANGRRSRLTLATAAVAGVTALDVYCSTRAPQLTRDIHLIKSIIVDRPAEELYQYWRQFERLPSFMQHLESVSRTGDNRWHWIAKIPGGMSVEWDAEIINERAGELIAWRSLPGADIHNSGSVRFERAPGGRGTLVRVQMLYSPPGGVAGANVARLFGEAPMQVIAQDLHRFKQLMETGEIARTEGQPAGRPASQAKYEELIKA